MAGKLMTHCGATNVNRADLGKIEAPPATKTWQPVKHIELLEGIQYALSKQQISITKEDLAVQRRGEFFFGVLDLKMKTGTDSEFTSLLGVRASNNKLVAIQIAVGARVFVCDNMAFSGDMIALKRKHTSGLDLAAELDDAISKFAVKFQSFSQEIATMRRKEIKDSEAKLIMFDNIVTKKIMPVRLLDKVNKEYFVPRHAEFAPRNLWSLHNAFTEAAKELGEDRKFRALKGLGDSFKEIVKEAA